MIPPLNVPNAPKVVSGAAPIPPSEMRAEDVFHLNSAIEPSLVIGEGQDNENSEVVLVDEDIPRDDSDVEVAEAAPLVDPLTAGHSSNVGDLHTTNSAVVVSYAQSSKQSNLNTLKRSEHMSDVIKVSDGEHDECKIVGYSPAKALTLEYGRGQPSPAKPPKMKEAAKPKKKNRSDTIYVQTQGRDSRQGRIDRLHAID